MALWIRCCTISSHGLPGLLLLCLKFWPNSGTTWYLFPSVHLSLASFFSSFFDGFPQLDLVSHSLCPSSKHFHVAFWNSASVFKLPASPNFFSEYPFYILATPWEYHVSCHLLSVGGFSSQLEVFHRLRVIAVSSAFHTLFVTALHSKHHFSSSFKITGPLKTGMAQYHQLPFCHCPLWSPRLLPSYYDSSHHSYWFQHYCEWSISTFTPQFINLFILSTSAYSPP